VVEENLKSGSDNKDNAEYIRMLVNFDEGKFGEVWRDVLAKVWTAVKKIMKTAWQNEIKLNAYM
jgi:hypothetical protein